jgi:hypothetical protein
MCPEWNDAFAPEMLKRLLLSFVLILGTLTISTTSKSQVVGALLGYAEASTSATHELARPMSAEQVKQISQTSVRDRVALSLREIGNSFYSDAVRGIVDGLGQGGTRTFTAPIPTTSASLTMQSSLNVSVKYDRRPLGGVLCIRVDIVPAFSGIGSSTRPIASRQFAQAVDDFDDHFVATTVTRLTNELSSEIATK